MQIFVAVALVALLAMTAYNTYVVARTVQAFRAFGQELEGAFGSAEDIPTDFGSDFGSDFDSDFAGDQAACVHVAGGTDLSQATVDEAWAMAEPGGDVEAALTQWQEANAVGDDSDLDDAEVAVMDACAAYGG